MSPLIFICSLWHGLLYCCVSDLSFIRVHHPAALVPSADVVFPWERLHWTEQGSPGAGTASEKSTREPPTLQGPTLAESSQLPADPSLGGLATCKAPLLSLDALG